MRSNYRTINSKVLTAGAMLIALAAIPFFDSCGASYAAPSDPAIQVASEGASFPDGAADSASSSNSASTTNFARNARRRARRAQKSNAESEEATSAGNSPNSTNASGSLNSSGSSNSPATPATGGANITNSGNGNIFDGRRGREFGGKRRMGGGGAGMIGRAPLDLSQLNLTDEQKTKITDSRSKTKVKAKEIQQGIKAKRAEMRDMMFDPAISATQIRTKRAELRTLQDQAEMLMLNDFLSMRAVLSAEQLRKLNPAGRGIAEAPVASQSTEGAK